MFRPFGDLGLNQLDYLGVPPTPPTDSSWTSWTDDIPLCVHTGVGFAQNQVYRRDGHRTSEHELEDESFHFQVDDGNICLYGVFDGHFGPQAAKFVVQKMPAEIILDQQLTEATTEDKVREVLRQAFLSVEREYFNDAIGAKLAERATYISEMTYDGESPYETFREYPQVLAELNKEVESGTTAVVALIFNGKLYVSNVGCCRALLCRTDKDGVLKVIQLSVDHDLRNQDERRRLQDIGLNPEELRRHGKIGNQTNTRCLGNYLVKGGYKEFRSLRNAKNEPVLPDPEIHPAVKVDESFRFLVLLSDGLYQALREASESEHVDIQLAKMIVEEFKTQSTLNLVAQAVVDKVSRMHHDYYMNMSNTLPKVTRRDDMTLLVRNFHIPLKNATNSGIKNGPTSSGYHNNNDCSTPTNTTLDSCPSPKILRNSPFQTVSNTEATTSTESSDLLTQSNHKLPLDENGRIAPYVAFADYYKNLASKSWTDADMQVNSGVAKELDIKSADLFS